MLSRLMSAALVALVVTLVMAVSLGQVRTWELAAAFAPVGAYLLAIAGSRRNRELLLEAETISEQATLARLEATLGKLLAAARYAKQYGLFSLEDKVHEFDSALARAGLSLLSAGCSNEEIRLGLDAALQKQLACLDEARDLLIKGAKLALVVEVVRFGLLLALAKGGQGFPLPLGLITVLLVVLLGNMPVIAALQAAGKQLIAISPRVEGLLAMMACGRGRAACRNWLESVEANSV